MNRWPTLVTIAIALGLALTAPGQVQAATIYGTIRQDGRPLTNIGVELVCDRATDRQQTDARGTYRFTTNQTGRCELRAQGGSAPVTLYGEPTRYDFDVRQEGGRSLLIRH
jgi:hypothetical protein